MPPKHGQSNNNDAVNPRNLKHKLHSLKTKSNLSTRQLTLFALVFALIGGFVLWKSFAQGPLVASLEAERMSLPGGGSVISDSSASGGQAIKITNGGIATGSVNFPGSANSFTVIARGDQCNGAPAMTVQIDGIHDLVGASVSSSPWTNYSFTPTTAWAAGSHTLSISFDNPYSTTAYKGNSKKIRSSCIRALYVDVTSFYGPNAPPPPPAPTVTLSASPTSLSAGQSSTLTWSSTNSTSCTASGAWSGTEATSGSASTAALSQTSTYTLTCTGGGGTANASTTVAVSSGTTSSLDIAGDGAWRISTYDLQLGELTLQLGRYSVVVANDWQAHDALTGAGQVSPAQIHTDSPNTKVAMYAAGPDIDTTATTLAGEQYETNTGVTIYDVNTYNHPEWLLRDSSGNMLYNAGYPWMAIGDFGNPSFQQQWVQNVVARAKSLGFNGVSIDDIVNSFGGILGGKVAVKYPTQSAWQQAMLSFMGYAVPALKAQGLYVGAEVFGWDDANVNGDNNNGVADANWWQQLISTSHLNAIFNEYFEQNANNFSQSFDNTHLDWTDNWDGWLKLIDVAQNNGADFWGLNYATGNATTDVRLKNYGKGSFLLKWNGNRYGVYFWQNGRDATSGTNPWALDWTMDIGTPTNSMYSVGSGAFRRDYSAGTVVVNPMPTAQTISLGGTYKDAYGNAYTSVTLGPTSAAILHN